MTIKRWITGMVPFLLVAGAGFLFYYFIPVSFNRVKEPFDSGKREVGFIDLADLRIAAAADLKFAMEDLIHAFQEEENSKGGMAVTYGSSGHFFSLLSNQAPFDLFLSADTFYSTELAKQGLALERASFIYARGRLVVWARRGSAIPVEKEGIHALLDSRVRHIALANPLHAPYGKAALAALKTLGLYQVIQSKLVYGEDVSQAAQFVQSGTAEIGLIPLALASAPELKREGVYEEIPIGDYPPLEQGGVILKWVRNPTLARAFRSFLLGPRGQKILEQYGFQQP